MEEVPLSLRKVNYAVSWGDRCAIAVFGNDKTMHADSGHDSHDELTTIGALRRSGAPGHGGGPVCQHSRFCANISPWRLTPDT